MGQQSLIYSFVARGTVILSEYTEFTGNFTTIASQCLQKLPSTNNKFTYNCDGHTFNYLVEDGYSNYYPLYYIRSVLYFALICDFVCLMFDLYGGSVSYLFWGNDDVVCFDYMIDLLIYDVLLVMRILDSVMYVS